jgi:hypothetical protein
MHLFRAGHAGRSVPRRVARTCLASGRPAGRRPNRAAILPGRRLDETFLKAAPGADLHVEVRALWRWPVCGLLVGEARWGRRPRARAERQMAPVALTGEVACVEDSGGHGGYVGVGVRGGRLVEGIPVPGVTSSHHSTGGRPINPGRKCPGRRRTFGSSTGASTSALIAPAADIASCTACTCAGVAGTQADP